MVLGWCSEIIYRCTIAWQTTKSAVYMRPFIHGIILTVSWPGQLPADWPIRS